MPIHFPVIGRESGTSKMTFDLADLIPTTELSEQHFYQFRVSFTSSNGDMLDEVIYPLDLVE
ncbi:hypothetical protein [Catenovulum agarivorans]|uniref:hypothetical protein n=1 Tax=Catenovulum agarivorans TaxID=1172192 RepID=UPI000A2F0EF8|nr:hypothetical protein [Catenovulum agarivorans]